MATPKTVIAIGIKPAGKPSPMDESGPKDSSDNGVEIPMPDGFTWPDDADPERGEKFLCTICKGPDDQTLVIKDLDGLPFEKESPEEDASDEDQGEQDSSYKPGSMNDLVMGSLKKYQ